jgi:hypothetical protein
MPYRSFVLPQAVLVRQAEVWAEDKSPCRAIFMGVTLNCTSRDLQVSSSSRPDMYLGNTIPQPGLRALLPVCWWLCMYASQGACASS